MLKNVKAERATSLGSSLHKIEALSQIRFWLGEDTKCADILELSKIVRGAAIMVGVIFPYMVKIVKEWESSLGKI